MERILDARGQIYASRSTEKNYRIQEVEMCSEKSISVPRSTDFSLLSGKAQLEGRGRELEAQLGSAEGRGSDQGFLEGIGPRPERHNTRATGVKPLPVLQQGI